MKTPPDHPRLALAEATAQRILLRERIIKPPVPVKELLEEIAFVSSFEHKSELSFCLEHDSIWYVFINSKISEHSISFIQAHEMGHLFMKHLLIDRNRLTALQYLILDCEADHFAKNMIIPADWLRLMCASNCVSESDVAELAKLFLVTQATLVDRLLDLEINCGFDVHNWRALHRQTPLQHAKEHPNLRQLKKMITAGIEK